MKPLVIAGLLLTGFLFAFGLAYAEDCGNSCNTTTWELQYQGVTVSVGDMTEEECIALKDEIEQQTQPFTDLVCVEVPVMREEV